MKRLILCLGLLFAGLVQADVIPGASYFGVYSKDGVRPDGSVQCCIEIYFYRERIGDPKIWGTIAGFSVKIPTDQMSLEIPAEYDYKKHEIIVFFDRSGNIIATHCMDRKVFYDLKYYQADAFLYHPALDRTAKPIAKKAVLVTRCEGLFFIDCIMLLDAHGRCIYAAKYMGKGYEKHASQFVDFQIDQVEDQRTKGIYKGLKRLWRNNYVLNKKSFYRA